MCVVWVGWALDGIELDRFLIQLMRVCRPIRPAASLPVLWLHSNDDICVCFFLARYRRKGSYIRASTHRYKCTHANPTPMSTFERVGQHMILRFYEVTIGAS